MYILLIKTKNFITCISDILKSNVTKYSTSIPSIIRHQTSIYKVHRYNRKNVEPHNSYIVNDVKLNITEPMKPEYRINNLSAYSML